MALLAVGFDIDGTLYPNYKAHVRSVPFCVANAKKVLAFARTRRRMREESALSEMLSDPSEAEVKIFAEESGLSRNEARKIRDELIYQTWEKSFRGMTPYSGVRQALLQLRQAGLKLAALSDFPVGKKLEYFHLADLFDVATGFPESGGLKPRPEPFLVMAEKLGVAPSDILYVGNKLDYDVYGAEGAGMRGALVGPPGRHAPEGTLVYRDYQHLAESVLSEVVS